MAKGKLTTKKLTKIFQRLGAKDPESLAKSQIEDGIPQLVGFLFLKSLWQSVVNEGDSKWIETQLAYAEKEPDGPHAGAGHAIASLRAKGATDEELTDLVRCTQAESLFAFCLILDNPYDALQDLDPELAEEMGWVFAQTDGEENIVAIAGGFHESVLEMDPTGREMRPRKRLDNGESE